MASNNKDNKTVRPLLIGRFTQLSLWKKAVIVVIVLVLLLFAGIKVFGQKSTTSQ
jgi:hypothetical protein